MPRFAAILPAAGSSIRYGRNKLFEMLGSATVLQHTLEAFLKRSDVAIVVMPMPAGEDSWAEAPEGLRQFVKQPRIRLCAGGATRAQSVRNALQEVPPEIEWVAVHDAARPLVSQALINRTLATAEAHGAAVPAMAVHLTIKQATGPLPAKVQRTVPRQALWAMQTPQIMRRSQLLEAFNTCPLPLDQVTDDVQVLELAEREVWLVEGEERNLKITTPMDLRVAEMMLGRAE